MNYDDLERLVVCSACGTELEAVRPGKHQHPGDTLRLCETIQELQRDLQDTRDALEAFCEKSFDQLKYPNLVKRGLEVLCKQ